MKSSLVSSASIAILAFLTSCKGVESVLAPPPSADSTDLTSQRPDQSLIIDGTTYSTPYFGGSIRREGRAVGRDTLPLAVLDFMVSDSKGSLQVVGHLDLVGPQRASYALDSLNNPRWSEVHLDRYRAGIDSCNYASRSGIVTIDRWVDTTVNGLTGKSVTGSVQATLFTFLPQKASCPSTIPVSFGFRNVHLDDSPQ